MSAVLIPAPWRRTFGRRTTCNHIRARAHVPKDRQTALTKPEIAIEEIDRVIASGARYAADIALTFPVVKA